MSRREEVWVKAYCAALAGHRSHSEGYFEEESSIQEWCKLDADFAVKAFHLFCSIDVVD